MNLSGNFIITGKLIQECKQVIVRTTVEEAVYLLEKALRDNYGFSFFHEKGEWGKPLRQELNNLLTAIKNLLPKKNKKAIMLDLLYWLVINTVSFIPNNLEDHTANLMIWGFIFTMLLYVSTPRNQNQVGQ